MDIIFWGTPDFAKIILERLIKTKYKPILVVTQPDQPAGRKQILTPPPVKILAKKYKIPIVQPEKLNKTTTKRLRTKNCGLAIVAAYGKVIPKEILDIPKYGTLNVHPSLLPRWRGPSPIQYAILNGDKETGVSIMLMDERIDHGPILASREFSIFPSTSSRSRAKSEDLSRAKSRDNFQFSNGFGKPTTSELSKKLAEIGGNLLIETIPKWIAGKIKPQEQKHSRATYSKILTKKDGHIDWHKSAEEIERQIRAFTPWPGSFTFWNKMRIKIIRGYIVQETSAIALSPGRTFLSQNNKLAVQTGGGAFVIEKLQPEGKTEITARQFLNGHAEILRGVLK